MSTSKWWAYVQSITGDVAHTQIADTAGFDKSVLTRWKQGSRPAVEFAVSFARAYKRPPVEALAAAGYITEAEANVREVKVRVDEIGTVELAEELLARVSANVGGQVQPETRRHLKAVADTSEDTSDPDLRTP